MGTSTGSTGRPTRRSKVWSHNTSYTGAAGVHSETGKKADVIQQSGQRQLGISVSGLAALHQKEMRSLHQEIRSLHRHRRSLESSMVAYTERMRKISTERRQLALAARGSREQEKEGISADGSSDRLSTSTGTDSSTTAARSLGRDAHVTRHPHDVTRKSSSNNSALTLLAVPRTSSSTSSSFSSSFSTTSTGMSGPPSSRSLDDVSFRAQGHHHHPISPPLSPPRRRVGTWERPEVFSLRLGMQTQAGAMMTAAHHHPDSDDGETPSARPDPDLDPDHDPPVVAIRPFPEAGVSLGVRIDESGQVVSLDPDCSDRASETSSMMSQSSSRKVIRTREDYWSYRKKSHHRMSLPAPIPQPQSPAAKKNTPLTESTSTHSPRPRPQPLPGPRPSPRRRRSTKTYHTSFRYSDAVEDAMLCLERTGRGDVSKGAVRRVSQSLPALDLRDLEEDRHRLKRDDGHDGSARTSDSLTSGRKSHGGLVGDGEGEGRSTIAGDGDEGQGQDSDFGDSEGEGNSSLASDGDEDQGHNSLLGDNESGGHSSLAVDGDGGQRQGHGGSLGGDGEGELEAAGDDDGQRGTDHHPHPSPSPFLLTQHAKH